MMSSNIFDKYIIFSKKCISKYMKLVMGNKFDQEIFDHLLKTYIDARYYDRTKEDSNDFLYKIGVEMVNRYEMMESEGFDLNALQNTFATFRSIIFFDSVVEVPSIREKVEEVAIQREENLGFKKSDKFVNKLFDEVKNDLIKKREFIESYETKDFELDYFLVDEKNLYETNLMHKLKFPKLYNKNAIDKVFSSKDISEESLYVEYKMVSLKVLRDIIKGRFNKKYLVRYCNDLNTKKNKQKSLFDILDNDVLKEKVVIKTNFSDFVKEKEVFYGKIRYGFKFAISLDESFVPSESNLEILSLFRYVLVDEKSKFYNVLKNKPSLNVIRK